MVALLARLALLCYTFDSMADSDDSVLDKAEGFARRLLERLGAQVDSKLAPGDQLALGARQVGELASKLERLIESSLKEDRNGTKRLAPNRFRVLFTYEEASRLSEKYLQALAEELKATANEYINNRRYETPGPVEVEAKSDMFAKSTTIKASFEGDTGMALPDESRSTGATSGKSASPSQSPKARAVSLQDPQGQSYRIELKAVSAPVYIGRAAGNVLRIDDSSISRLHCSFTLRSNGEVVVSDLGSSNGTFVNEHMLGSNEARPVKPGDIVGVGDIRLTISDIE